MLLGRYGKSIQSYIEELTGFKLIKEQIDLLDLFKDTEIKEAAGSCGRGFSKTMLSAGTTLWFADEYASYMHKDLEILLVSSQDRIYQQLNWMFEKGKERFGYDEATKKYSRLKQGGIYDALMKEKAEIWSKDFKNLTCIYPVMSTSKSARSHRCDIAIVDEAADCSRETLTAVMGCRTRNIAKLILLSTPHKTGSMFNDIVADYKRYGFKVYMASAEVCPWQEESNKSAKRLMTPQDYAIEICGRLPMKEERSIFPSKNIDAAIQDVEPIREGGPNSRVEAGLDCGYNNTVYALRERIGTVKTKIIFLKEWEKKSIEEIAPEIASLLELHKPYLFKIDSKPPHYKAHIQKYTRRSIYQIDASKKVEIEGEDEPTNHKKQMVGQFRRKLMEKNLIVPNPELCGEQKEIFKKFIDQLRVYRFGMRDGDDIIDAVLLACYEPVEPLGSQTGGRVYAKWK